MKSQTHGFRRGKQHMSIQLSLGNGEETLSADLASFEQRSKIAFDRILELRQGALRTVHACSGHPHRHA